jgi:hypothetical protein
VRERRGKERGRERRVSERERGGGGGIKQTEYMHVSMHTIFLDLHTRSPHYRGDTNIHVYEPVR